jgi:hypothetical protein
MPPGVAVDELWARAKATFGAAAVRNNAFLSWRYMPGAGKTYEVVSVFDDRAGGRLAALAFVRRQRTDADPRLRGIKVATLADILFPATDLDAGVAAIAGAERVARRMGADALLTTASHSAVHHALARRAAVRVPGNVHLMIRDPKKANGIDTTLESWWMTRGDASSDEAF